MRARRSNGCYGKECTPKAEAELYDRWYRNTYQASPPAFFELVERHLAAGLLKAGIPEK